MLSVPLSSMVIKIYSTENQKVAVDFLQVNFNFKLAKNKKDRVKKVLDVLHAT